MVLIANSFIQLPGWVTSLNPINSIRIRLTFVFLVVFGGVMALSSWISYRAFVERYQEEFDSYLYNHAVDLSSMTSVDMFGNLSTRNYSPFELEKRWPFPVHRSYVQVRDQYGEIVGKSGNLQDFELPLDPKDFPLLEKKGALFNTLNGFAIQTRRRVSDLPDYRLISYVVRRPGLPLLILQVAAPMGSLERNQERLKTLLFLLVPISLLIAGGLGFWLTNRAFRPVRLMMKKTSEIQLADLRERLPLPTGDWELTELAITLNRLLDRVESAVKLQERFVSDASHQLKTPLAILRGEIELLLQTSVPDHVKNVLTSLGQEVSQLGKLVENLLILARADSGGFTLQLESVRLDELLLDLVARFEHYAHSKGIQLKFDTETNPTQGDGVVDFEIRGDGALLRSLIQNLIDNAIKYSSSGGTVFIRLQETAQACIVEVQDQGAGISPTDLDRIFERFYRSPNHTASTSGAGLGLPIAKKIAELHGGQLSAQSKLGAGATFRFRVEKSS